MSRLPRFLRIQQQEASLRQQQAGEIYKRRHREDGLMVEDQDAEQQVIEAEAILHHHLIPLPRAIDTSIR